MSPTSIARGFVVGVVASLLGAPALAEGQENQSRKVATDLFDAGVARMGAGRCDETPVADIAACREARDAFRRAYALYPGGLGALRNAAYVEKNLGLVASAAHDFRELARKAPLD